MKTEKHQIVHGTYSAKRAQLSDIQDTHRLRDLLVQAFGSASGELYQEGYKVCKTALLDRSVSLSA